MAKERAPRNRTITLTEDEKTVYGKKLYVPAVADRSACASMLQTEPASPAVERICLDSILNKTVNADLFNILDRLPSDFADLLVLDPPYNLDKNFGGLKFAKKNDDAYLLYLRSWFPRILHVLKPTGSVYICGDWKSTFCLYEIMRENVIIRNRIVWQREKGRGANANWKNSSEDIWFGTISDEYYFNLDSVKQKRRVLAPYRENGKPKDWEETEEGNFRLTCPGNFWDDISVPYWSMPENTDHPTQKPEKLIAKLMLASCPAGGIVVDPFLGSGTTSVVAKKLGRNYIGIEMNREYCCWAEKRLAMAETDRNIQGYSDGVFWERNSLRSSRTGR